MNAILVAALPRRGSTSWRREKGGQPAYRLARSPALRSRSKGYTVALLSLICGGRRSDSTRLCPRHKNQLRELATSRARAACSLAARAAASCQRDARDGAARAAGGDVGVAGAAHHQSVHPEGHAGETARASEGCSRVLRSRYERKRLAIGA